MIGRITGARLVSALVGCGTLFTSLPANAQRAAPRAATSRVVVPAVRADLLLDRDAGAQLAAGAAIAVAYNLRLAADLGVGGVRREMNWRPTGRLDLLVRWLSDPFRQSRWAINAGGGIGVRVEADRTSRTVAIVTIGVEARGDSRWVRGVEAGMGGGFRLGATLRRSTPRTR